MSIDLHELEDDARVVRDAEVLALVAAVRAARNLDGKDHGRAWTDLQEALAPFTDSAENKA